MARRERRKQPRIPVDLEVFLDPAASGEHENVSLRLRTRNLNARGAFLELSDPGEPRPPWANAEWWTDRRVRIQVSGSPLAHGESLACDAEVRWVERRGPKRRVVGIGVLFLTPSEVWLSAIHEFLASLVK
jgi:hypothetical protein